MAILLHSKTAACSMPVLRFLEFFNEQVDVFVLNHNRFKVCCHPAFSQSMEISSDLCCFYGGGISHNEDIMHSFQKFIVV